LGRDLKRGPFTAKDLKRVLKADGWVGASGGNHDVWEHPEKPGKFAVSDKWTSLRAWDPILKGMIRTCGIDKKRLLRMLNGIDE
jgi:predicted RNA binding protein YcfA (HicA-like mRNA interferase family)